MPDTTMQVDLALNAAKDHAVRAWYLFTSDRNLKPIVPSWRTAATPSGEPRLSVEVVGPGAAHALHQFTSHYPLILGEPGDLRPVYDYSVPGRVACVWRHLGVWVELWHPDTLPTVEQPAPAITPPSGRRWATRASGRLPFKRRTKETTA